jgi:hypothetical protein
MMGHLERWIIGAFVIAGLPLSACTATSTEEAGNPPAKVQLVDGSDQARVILSADAARRLGVETIVVRESSGAPGDGALIIPYAAVLYDPAGMTWTYTSPEPLVFVRQPIQITDIREGLAFLSSGPPAGTLVVTVGASELLGTEYEVSEE